MPAHSGGRTRSGITALGDPTPGSPLHVIAQQRSDADPPQYRKRLSEGPDGPHYRLKGGWLLSVDDLRECTRTIGKMLLSNGQRRRADECAALTKQLKRTQTAPKKLRVPAWLESDILQGFGVLPGDHRFAPDDVRTIKKFPSVAAYRRRDRRRKNSRAEIEEASMLSNMSTPAEVRVKGFAGFENRPRSRPNAFFAPNGP